MNCDTCGKELKNYAIRANFGNFPVDEIGDVDSLKHFCYVGGFPENSPCYVEAFSQQPSVTSGELVKLKKTINSGA